FSVGRILVGRYSATALASLQISSVVVWSLYSVLTAFSAGTLAVVARSMGARDLPQAALAARGALTLAATLGLSTAVPLLIGRHRLLADFVPKAEAVVLANAEAYLWIVLPAFPLSFVEAIAAACLQASGDTRTPLLAAAGGNIVHLAVSGLFIFGV